VESDVLALLEFSRVLASGGSLLLRLPAYDWLRGQHDQVVHTRRRYTLRQVKQLLSSSGFRIRTASYANMVLFLPGLVKRLSERIFPADHIISDLELPVGRLSGLLRFILSSEAGLISSPGLPFGLSVIALGQKIA
jgi:hypothetical protein